MGLLNWLKRVFLGGEESLVPRFHGEGLCPYCGEPLRTAQARQCFICGADWHNPTNVFRRGSPSAAPLQQTATSAPNSWTSQHLVYPGAPADAEISSTHASSSTAGSQTGMDSGAGAQGSSSLAGLDLGKFAPLAHADVKKEAGQVGSLWGNPWFGRRDLIPPTSDQRTELIDRAMVGQGMIAPEELEEIHRVGEAMDRVRPDLAQASQIADQAVARTLEQREQIKQQKKAEAEAKKQRRRREIAHRKATDIIYLGRGVSRGLADRRVNVERLNQLSLPVLASPADIAQAMDISIGRLRWLAFHNEASRRTHYITFEVAKKSGGVRQLAAPHQSLRRCQEWILREVLEKTACHPAAHGFVKGRSIVTNAAPHARADVVVNADLEGFFPTISFSRVKGVFRSLGYSPAASTIMALLCTEAPRKTVKYQGVEYFVAVGQRSLPQGACTSPWLSNLVARRIDARLSGLAAKLGWQYTRYADDMTFSAQGEAAAKTAYLLARLRHIVQEEGFSLNSKKTRILRANCRQSVTGVVVNQRPGAPRKLVRRLRAILHGARLYGLQSQNRENLPHFESWLAGMIAYVCMLNPQQGLPLKKEWDMLKNA